MAPSSNPPRPLAQSKGWHWPAALELAGWLGVIGLAVYFLKVSWLKWPEPQIDFGAQLYTPWRLSEGDVLYRDVAQNYGPLSQYFNALLFSVFGPGLSVLVTANLVIFGVILFTLGRLIRRAWGAGAAIFASALFVTVFGFSQYVGIGNSNYATPYAHECTHGFLVCLLLVDCLRRWLEKPTRAQSALAGFLLGLTAVLKPEFMLAGGALTVTAFLLRPKSERTYLWAGALGAILPTLLFLLWFAVRLPLSEALPAATGAWSVMLTAPEILHNPMQAQFLGLDRPLENFASHLTGTAYALLLLNALAGTAWSARRLTRPWLEYTLTAAVMALLVWVSLVKIDWVNSGRCLLGLVLMYVGLKAWTAWRAGPGAGPTDGPTCLRILFAVLALSLMARMALNGRIFQFGFYQAALAALLVPAVLVGELPAWLKLERGKALLVGGTLALLVPGAIVLARRSGHILALKTATVGSGRDQFHAFGPPLTINAQLIAEASEFLKQQPAPTALVLPEGLMINYLARKVSPVPPLFFYFNATAHGREALLVAQLEKHPPEWAVLLSRDLRDAGIDRYGEESGSGREMLAWLATHYEAKDKLGGDPLDPDQQGLILYHRK